MNQTNYMHVCSDTLKCSCGWTGCTCEIKTTTSSKVTDNETKYFQLCPKCALVVSTSTLTTT